MVRSAEKFQQGGRAMQVAAVLGSLALLVSTLACAPATEGRAPMPADTVRLAEPPYALDQPLVIHELDKDLREISGLTVLDERHVAAVQDEDGDVFTLDIVTGEVVDRARFGKDGDYEGIERVGERLFVLRSDGDLYEIADRRASDFDADKMETPLRAAHDTEGLAYDPVGERLLIACKEHAGKGLAGKKAIYAFDLATRTLSEAPAYLIDLKAFNARSGGPVIEQRLRDALLPVADLSGFKPSALAVHPLTDRLYVLSSARASLVVLERDGTLAGVWPLDDDLLPQPEGLAFLPDGDLLIASEGSRRGVLVRYRYAPR